MVLYRAFPNQWWLAHGGFGIGPFDDRTILRASRVACTPTIDGCELVSTKLGVTELSPRRKLERGRRWQELDPTELPASVTAYEREGLEPVSGCCTTFDAMPKVAWCPIDDWQVYLDAPPARSGRLRNGWNAHPAGSIVFAATSWLEDGLVIVDLPGESG